MSGEATTLTRALPSLERIREEKARLASAGVKYVLSCWIDMLGIPKTKPVPLSNFEALCLGKGPQFAVHSVSFVPELGPADSDQIPVPDLDTLLAGCHQAVTDWEVREYLRLY
jgi:glutamine synthetase